MLRPSGTSNAIDTERDITIPVITWRADSEAEAGRLASKLQARGHLVGPAPFYKREFPNEAPFWEVWETNFPEKHEGHCWMADGRTDSPCAHAGCEARLSDPAALHAECPGTSPYVPCFLVLSNLRGWFAVHYDGRIAFLEGHRRTGAAGFWCYDRTCSEQWDRRHFETGDNSARFKRPLAGTDDSKGAG